MLHTLRRLRYCLNPTSQRCIVQENRRHYHFSSAPKLSNNSVPAIQFASKKTHVLDLVLQNPLHLKNDTFVTQLATVKQLNLSGADDIDDSFLQHIATYLPQLENFNVNGCRQFSDVGLKAIAKGCPKLQTIHLNHCKDITDKSILALSQACTDLNHIDFGNCPRISDLGMLSLTEQPNCLGFVNASLCQDVSDFGIETLSRKHLYGLSLRGCHDVSDRGLIRGLENSPCLEWLDISSAAKLSCATITFLAHHASMLAHLYAYNMADLDDRVMMVLLEKCPCLFSLNIGMACGITDTTMLQIPQKLPLLQQLNVSHNPNITGQGLAALIKCRNLQYLNVSSCPNMGDQDINRLVQQSPSLVHLDIRHCKGISHRCITALNAQYPGLHLLCNHDDPFHLPAKTRDHHHDVQPT